MTQGHPNPEQKNSKRPLAVCVCGAPLISTMAFRRFEFYCVDCGRLYGFLDPSPRVPTPELLARYEALQAEWDEHAGAKLLVNGWYDWCERCKGSGEYHRAHATNEQREADRVARAWLTERAAQ